MVFPHAVNTPLRIALPAGLSMLLGVAALLAGCASEPRVEGPRVTVPSFTANTDPDPAVRQAAPVAIPDIRCERQQGGLIRGPVDRRQLALVFTAHEFGEGGGTILDELRRHHAKGSFFVTGVYLAQPGNQALLRRIVNEGHYLGPHSDQHLLYCSWEKPPKLLVTPDQFRADLGANLDKLTALGVQRHQVRFFLPPFEHYNQAIAAWTSGLGLRLVNFTPGTRANADYTEEGAPNFVSSQAIFDSIVACEREDPHGLNGYLLLLHLGAGPKRADKFHTRFGALLDSLAGRGYQFVRVDELFGPPATTP